MENRALLEVKDLKTYFYTEEGVVPSVDGLSFQLQEKETLAIVGESGCGKSVTSLSILGLIPSPGKVEGGEILYHGDDLLKKTNKEMLKIRGEEISMIFQEPMTSLNPVFPVGFQIAESLKYHRNAKKSEARKRAVELLAMVGIPSPEKVAGDYPHQLSGGMRQRVMIAMALACRPKILIADEPTTALDVTIQAQILRLLNQLKEQMGTSIILITHDLGIVAQTAQRVLVMYAGEAVEYTDVHFIFKDPQHPYTVGLLAALPKLKGEQDRLFSIKGSVPGIGEYPTGCRFSPRCEHAMEICKAQKPSMTETAPGHWVRCWRCKGGCGNE